MRHRSAHKKRKAHQEDTLPSLHPTSTIQDAHKEHALSCQIPHLVGDSEIAMQFSCGILDLLPDGVLVYDQEGKLVQMNARSSIWFSSLSDILTQPFKQRCSQLTPTDLQGNPLAIEDLVLSRLLKEEACNHLENIDILLYLPDGHQMQLNVSGTRLLDRQQRVRGAILVLRDMTERYNLEQLQQQIYTESEAHRTLLQTILDTLPSSIALVRGPDARLVLANRATTAMWGASWVKDQSLEDFFQHHNISVVSDDGSETFAHLQVLQEGKPVLQQQYTIHAADQRIIPVLVNAVPFDLTHLYPDDWTASNNKPPNTSEENWAALVVSQDVSTLKETERLKDEFLSLAAHELRTPLTILNSYVQLLQKHLQKKGTLSEQTEELFISIERARHQLVDLTKLMLDVTHIQAGRLKVFPQPLNLLEMVEGIITRLQTTTMTHQIVLHSTLKHLTISADPARAEQILHNLIGNAIKYSTDGGAIDVKVWKEGSTKEALLSISDQGIGIPLEQQTKLFERFVRGGNTHKITGTGLGLYLCRTLIEMQAGRIWFESKEGEGSTFYLAFPLVTHEEQDLSPGG